MRTVRYELSGLGRLWRECPRGTTTYTTAQVGDVVRFDTAPTRASMFEGLQGGAGDGESSRLRSGAPVPGIDAGGGVLGHPATVVVLGVIYVLATSIANTGTPGAVAGVVLMVLSGGIAAVAQPRRAILVWGAILLLVLGGLATGATSSSASLLAAGLVAGAPIPLAVLAAVAGPLCRPRELAGDLPPI